MIKTYVDSGVLIEAFRGSSVIAAPAIAVLGDSAREFVTSDFVRLEVLPKPTFLQRALERAFYNAYFAATVESVAVTPALVQRAMLRAETFGLSALDALHIAAAELAVVDEFITSERPASPLSRVNTVRVVSIRP